MKRARACVAVASLSAIVALLACNAVLGNGDKELADDLPTTTRDAAPRTPAEASTVDGGDTSLDAGVDAADAAPPLPTCEGGLSCEPTPTAGATECHSASLGMDVYCCPLPGALVIASACAPPLCGAGLTCATTPTTKADACRATATSTTDKYCCPSPGSTISGGKCISPVCGSGLTCAAAPVPGANACRQTSGSTTDIYCCPSGKTIVAGKCA